MHFWNGASSANRDTALLLRRMALGLCCLTSIVLFFYSVPARSEPEDKTKQYQEPAAFCQKFKDTERKGCYLKEYRAADTALNKTYRNLKDRINPAVATAMQIQSRNWIKYKDYMCGWQSQLETGSDNDTAEFYRCLNIQTRGRTTYLKQAFRIQHQPPGLAGDYDDAFGGSLTIESLEKNEKPKSNRKDPERGPAKLPELKEGKRYKFSIQVVRGPTHHIGELEGEFLIKNGNGLFQENPQCEDPNALEGCCELQFQMQPYSIMVREKNCGYYHGARAYFDGDFFRIK